MTPIDCNSIIAGGGSPGPSVAQASRLCSPRRPDHRRDACATKTRWPLLWTERLTAWHAVAAVWMAALAIVATGDVWADILLLARRDEENSHILLAPLVAVYLIWVRRQRLRYLRVRGRWIGVAIAAAGWTALTFGYARHMDGVWHGGALLLAIGCVLSVLGAQVLAAFAPAACVLAFVNSRCRDRFAMSDRSAAGGVVVGAHGMQRHCK